MNTPVYVTSVHDEIHDRFCTAYVCGRLLEYVIEEHRRHSTRNRPKTKHSTGPT